MSVYNVAVAEELAAIRTESFFREHARRANIPEAIGILKRMGEGNPPVKGDELPRPESIHASAPNRKRRARTRKPGAHPK